jgi:6-pyruvoyltetrahydropterin/6-carboxytetrahydropterin synthase
MFEVSVESEFCAAHAILIAGVREPNHGHNWRVTVTVRGESLDGEGLLCDFHAVESVLSEVIRPFQNSDLNQTPPFTDVNPTAEHVARHIGVEMNQRLRTSFARGASVYSVRVTEARGCAATYYARPEPR